MILLLQEVTEEAIKRQDQKKKKKKSKRDKISGSLNQAGVPIRREKWTDLKSIEKIDSVAFSDCFNVVSEKEVRAGKDGQFPGSG